MLAGAAIVLLDTQKFISTLHTLTRTPGSARDLLQEEAFLTPATLLGTPGTHCFYPLCLLLLNLSKQINIRKQ